jgi:tetratricopeptide (TPR) repeat protein
MKTLIILMLTFTAFIDPWLIRKINTAKSQAETAYKKGDYKTAISQYRYLVDSLDVHEDEISLNLGHAYYLDKDTAMAKSTYESISESLNGRVKSKAQQQLGVMANQASNHEEALAHFKQAIKADPANMDARYNYEMLKRKLEEQRKKDQQDKQDQSDKNKKMEPSEYAKRLKEQADRFVAQFQYENAYNLMMGGLKKDETVSTYQDYINRLGDVSGINKIYK